MDVAKVILQHKRLYKLVSEKRIKQSLDILDDMIKSTSSGDFRDEYENISNDIQEHAHIYDRWY